MLVFYHHSRKSKYRCPQGAAVCGSRVVLSGDIEAGCTAELRVWREESGELLIPMDVGDGVASAALTLPDTPGLVWYSFVLTDAEGRRLFYGGDSGEGRLYEEEPPSFHITVYDAAYETPEWFCEGVCYQIFPDRFKRSSWEDFHARANRRISDGFHLRLHENWSEQPVFEVEPDAEEYEPNDFFGGDLNGIRSALPQLKAFGVTCLYLNPVFVSASNHRYNTADYLHIDPLLGTDEDFTALAEEARQYGIRIMLDGVFSHTGSDSIYFNREGHFGSGGAWRDAKSPWREWYDFREDGTYDCWWGFKSLPNVKELTPSYLDFVTGKNGVLETWAARGAAGWRLDVADELPDEFIRRVRQKVKALDPNGVLLGEVWEEPVVKRGPEGRRGYVNGDELDAVMNYCFTRATVAFLTGKTDAYGYSDALHALRESYPPPFYRAALNLISSHDIVRAATALSGAPDRDALTREQQAVWQPSKEARALGRKRLLLAAALQNALPGVPCLYYGDEAGLDGMADPFNRKPYPWGREDTELKEGMRAFYLLRSRHGAFRNGYCRMGALSENVFCVVRYRGAASAAVLVNRGKAAETVSLSEEDFCEGPDEDRAFRLPGRGGADGADDGRMTVRIPPLTAIVLTGEESDEQKKNTEA